MRLLDKEKLILSAIQFRGEATVPELSKITGLKEHVIHYYMGQFRDEGLIRRWAFVDMFSLGFEEYEIYFSLASNSKGAKASLLKLLHEHPRIVWLAELGGDFQYAMTIYAKGVQEVYAFMESLAKKFGNIFFRKSIAVIVSFTVFAKKYIKSKAHESDVEMVRLIDTGKRNELDETDWKIMPALFLPALQSHHDMARAIGMPRATLEYRLKKLQSSGVIQRYIYHISTTKLGLQVFKLLVYAQGIQLPFHEALFNHCKKHPLISNFTHCLGSWDYEIGLDVTTPQMATDVVEGLYDKFGSAISDIKILPVFTQTNSINFMAPMPSNVTKR